MRTLSTVTLLVTVGFSFTACVRPQVKTRSETEIKVAVTCSADAATISVSPARIELYSYQSPFWTLETSPTASEIFINRTKDSGWPYGGTRPYKGKKGQPAKTNGKIDSNDPGVRKVYHYEVKATCADQTGPIKSITIDPDMIIIWKRAQEQ
ncbi:MAG: hypothetical protein ABI556_06035 [Gemmatimonadales bacterium]